MKEICVIVPNKAEQERVSFTAHLVSIASNFVSDIIIKDGRNSIDLKSIMGMMTLVINGGKEFTITIDGIDEDMAAAAIDHYFVD